MRDAGLAGDPPLKSIGVETLLTFKEILQKLPGLRPGSRRSPTSVAKTLLHVQAVLDKAGQPGPRNRDAAGILTGPVPWIRRPSAQEKTPRVIPPETFKIVYDATAGMDRPWIEGVKPPAWWKAILVVAFNTLLRRRSLFALRMSDIDWQARCLRMPGKSMKSKRAQVIRLNETALAALQSIRGDREFVFSGFKCKTQFYEQFHHLLDLAGLKREEHFLLHAIRANSAGILWETAPQAAQFTLGHRSIITTQRHYINGESMVTKALDGMPQPWKLNQALPATAAAAGQ
jgi:integrase